MFTTKFSFYEKKKDRSREVELSYTRMDMKTNVNYIYLNIIHKNIIFIFNGYNKISNSTFKEMGCFPTKF